MLSDWTRVCKIMKWSKLKWNVYREIIYYKLRILKNALRNYILVLLMTSVSPWANRFTVFLFVKEERGFWTPFCELLQFNNERCLISLGNCCVLSLIVVKNTSDQFQPWMILLYTSFFFLLIFKDNFLDYFFPFFLSVCFTQMKTW